MKNTPCIRCGKIRIAGRSWDEYIDKSLISYTMTICPDPRCQKIVDKQIKNQEEETRALHKESLKRRGNTRGKKSNRK